MQVHPDYLTKPMWQLLSEYGKEWLEEQHKIFTKIMESK